MKRLTSILIVMMIAALAVLSQGPAILGVPFMTYVYSSSMEPVIQINDAFFNWPTRDYRIGDIITYRPATLPAPYITHRIVDQSAEGFITQGDNSPYNDQQVGEPAVTQQQIAGEALSLLGKPIVIPQLGRLSAAAQGSLGGFTRVLAGILVSLGLLMLFTGKQGRRRSLKTRRRWRLGDLYRGIGILASILILMSISLNAHTTQVRYLVSENPGDANNRVMINQPGELTLYVSNRGLWPAWLEADGLVETIVTRESRLIWPLSSTQVTVLVPAHASVGWYQSYVTINQFPILFPEAFLSWTHNLSPFLSIILTVLAFWLYYQVWIACVSRIQGLEKWIPLKSFRDKLAARRLRKIKAQLLGRPGRGI